MAGLGHVEDVGFVPSPIDKALRAPVRGAEQGRRSRWPMTRGR